MIARKLDDRLLCEALFNVTRACNCKCLHCDPKVYTCAKNELNMDEILKCFGESKLLHTNTINIAGGEPFIKKDLDKLIVYLDKHKIPCVVATNGWFTEKIEQLLDQLEDNQTIRFAVSVDGTEELHDRIRQCHGSFQKAIESIKVIKERGFPVQVNTVVQKQNVSVLKDMDAFFKELDVPAMYIPKIFVTGEAFDFSTDEIIEAFRYIAYQRGRKYLLSKGTFKISNCHAGKNTWYLDSTGDIYTCWGSFYRNDSQRYILGNIRDNQFDEIFLSQKTAEIYETVVKKCSGCLVPCDFEREESFFGLDVSYTKDEVALLKDTLTTESDLTDFSVDESMWHLLEMYREETFRWMKSKESKLYLNSGMGKWRELEVKFLNINWGNDCEIFINGKKMRKIKSVIQDNVVTENFRIGGVKIKADDIVEIMFRVEKLWCPKEAGVSSDDRKLGMPVCSVKLMDR